MDWTVGLDLAARNLVAVGAYAVALAAVVPALGDRRELVAPLLVAVAALGTFAYARYGVGVLTDRCEACGERSYVGALWCPRTGTLRTAVTRPLAQAALAVALFALVGTLADAVRTFALWTAVPQGAIREYLLPDGDALFRALVLAGAAVAAVPVPVLVGNAIRLALRKAPVGGGANG